MWRGANWGGGALERKHPLLHPPPLLSSPADPALLHPPPPSWSLPALPPPPTLTSPSPEPGNEATHAALGYNARNVFALAAPGAPADLDLTSAGAWAALPDGRRLLRFALTTPGAPSHVLLFSDVALPSGASLHVWGSAAAAKAGSPPPAACAAACQAFSPGAPPLAAGRRLTTVELEGGTVNVEVTVPRGAREGSVVLVLARVMAGLGGVGLEAARPSSTATATATAAATTPTARRRRLAAYTQGTQFDFGLLQQRMDATAPCTPSVTCAFPTLAQPAAAVVSIYAVNLAVGAVALCTGTIIAAPLGAKYLLTAHHCLADEKEANSFEYWVLAFNHEARCGSLLAPPATQLMQGARLRFYDSHADILLLGLPYPVPDRFKHYRLGYDASPGAARPPAGAYVIHHPRGNFKRVSFINVTDRAPPTVPDPANATETNAAPKQQDWGGMRTAFTARPFPPGEVQPTDATHVEVAYSTGATQGGSSGAPLIDAVSGRVIGVLSGGFASCRVPGSPDYFGLLSRAPGLRQFLSSKPPTLAGAGGGGGGKGSTTSPTTLSRPSLPLSADVADQLVALADGKVVVDRLKGSPPPDHGPTVGFYPTFLALGGNVTARTFAYFLTDPPWANETITLEMAVATDVVGNVISVNGSAPIDNGPAAAVTLSTYTDTFTAADWDKKERSVTVRLPPAAVAALSPGGLARFRVIFSLTADVDPSYLVINTLAGVVQADRGAGWAGAEPRRCVALPCVSTDPGSKAPPGAKAVFEYTPTTRSTASAIICLEPGVLASAAVSVYVARKIRWTTTRDAFGSPDCISILGYDVSPGVPASVVVSDAFDLGAVLPLTLVRSVELREEWREGGAAGANGTASGDAAARAAATDKVAAEAAIAAAAAAAGVEMAPPSAAPDAPGAASTEPALVEGGAAGVAAATAANSTSTTVALAEPAAAAPAPSPAPQPGGTKADNPTSPPLPNWLTASRSAVTREQLAEKGIAAP